MRLVDADALHTLLIKTKSIGELSAKKAIRYVEDAPTVDAVPVIRCKDCKYYEDDIGDCIGFGDTYVTEEEYCSRARRKEE